MKPTKKLLCLFFCLINAVVFSQTTRITTGPNDGNPFGGTMRERIQIVYSQSDFLAMGFTAGSVIDTLCFNITTRNSTQPYNLTIKYYYTMVNFCFSFSTLAPSTLAGGVVFSGAVDMSVAGNFYVPPSGGILQIPLNFGIVWNGSANSLVIEMCWETNTSQQMDSTFALQTSCYQVFRLRSFSPVTACTMMPGGSVTSNTSLWRPEMFSCQPTQINNIQSSTFDFQIYPNPTHNSFVAKNISLTETSLLQILNTLGEIVYTQKLIGKSEYNIKPNLPQGIYFAEVSDKEKKTVRKLVIE